MDEVVYGIYKAWCDSSENESKAAFGYDIIGVVLTEKEAKNIIKKAKRITSKQYGWAAWEDKKDMYYGKIRILING